MAIGRAGKSLAGSAWGALKGNKMWVATNVWAGSSAYRSARDEGSGKLGAMSKGVVNALMVDFIGMPLYLGGMAATGLPRAVASGYETVTHRQRELSRFSMNRPFQNANFIDNEQIYTMRQASMAMGQNSRANLQHAMLGQEASHYHR